MEDWLSYTSGSVRNLFLVHCGSPYWILGTHRNPHVPLHFTSRIDVKSTPRPTSRGEPETGKTFGPRSEEESRHLMDYAEVTS